MQNVAHAESLLAEQLRSIAVTHIRDEGLTDAEVSVKLGVADRTVYCLMNRRRWDVSMAIRVVAGLGLSVRIAQSS